MSLPRSVRSLPVLLLLAALAAPSRAQSFTQTWTFDQSTSGQNIAWTSPTAVFPSASTFDTSYTLTKVEATVQYLFFTFPVDVTSSIPPEQLSGGGPIAGPAPITIFDSVIQYPEPPDPASVSAHVTTGMNAGGFGTFTATNVVLGNAIVDLGPPFGMQTVTIKSIRVAGSLTIHSTWFDLAQPLPGSNGPPLLVGSGPLIGGQPMALEISNAKSFGIGHMIVGFSLLNAPLKSGILGPNPSVIVSGLPLDITGAFTLSAAWPTGIPANFSIYFQTWLADAGGAQGFAATNTIRGVTP